MGLKYQKLIKQETFNYLQDVHNVTSILTKAPCIIFSIIKVKHVMKEGKFHVI